METAQVILIVVSLLVGITCFALTYKYLAEAMIFSSIKIGEATENDDDIAIRQAILLAEEAQDEIEMFDDGDVSEAFNSLYDDTGFIESVKKKLQDNPNFRVRVFFNDGDPRLKFIQAFKDHEKQVEIYKLKPSESRPSDVHYRLIDGGTKGIFSKHGRGDGNRIYRELNISTRSKHDKKKAGEIILKKYRQPRELFEKLGAA